MSRTRTRRTGSAFGLARCFAPARGALGPGEGVGILTRRSSSQAAPCPPPAVPPPPRRLWLRASLHGPSARGSGAARRRSGGREGGSRVCCTTGHLVGAAPEPPGILAAANILEHPLHRLADACGIRGTQDGEGLP